MHLVIATRGIKHEVDTWINELQAIYMKKGKEKDGKQGWVQMAVRPIQLWEFIFPREAMQEVLATVKLSDPWADQKYIQKYVTGMRKLMHLKKIPKVKPDTKMKVMFQAPNVQKLGIGIKLDVDNKDGEEML